jgi:SAM-dependent methyltransferase
MLYTRYDYAASLAAGRQVLEIGCGAGQGFGLLIAKGASLVGGDHSMPLLQSARAHYGSRVPLARLSADALPFRDATFDIVLIFEAAYYVPNLDRAFDQVRRILRPGGILVVVSANPERPDFIRSPHSVRYHTADEFRVALEGRQFIVSVSGAYPVASSDERAGLLGRVVGGIAAMLRRMLEFTHLTPRTLKGRARLKRLFNRDMRAVPAEIPHGFGEVAEREPVPPGPVTGFKVLYVTARR